MPAVPASDGEQPEHLAEAVADRGVRVRVRGVLADREGASEGSDSSSSGTAASSGSAAMSAGSVRPTSRYSARNSATSVSYTAQLPPAGVVQYPLEAWIRASTACPTS